MPGGGADEYGAEDGDDAGYEQEQQEDAFEGYARRALRERGGGRSAAPKPQGPVSPCATPMDEGRAQPHSQLTPRPSPRRHVASPRLLAAAALPTSP